MRSIVYCNTGVSTILTPDSPQKNHRHHIGWLPFSSLFLLDYSAYHPKKYLFLSSLLVSGNE